MLPATSPTFPDYVYNAPRLPANLNNGGKDLAQVI